MSPKLSETAWRTINDYIGARIRDRRVECGLSQEALGDAIGVNQKQMSRYEEGKSTFPISRISSLCRKLDITPNWFFESFPNEDNESFDETADPEQTDAKTTRLARRIQSLPVPIRRPLTVLVNAMSAFKFPSGDE